MKTLGIWKISQKKIEVNVFFKNSVEEAINLIRLKKYNKIKLITNGGHELTGKN